PRRSRPRRPRRPPSPSPRSRASRGRKSPRPTSPRAGGSPRAATRPSPPARRRRARRGRQPPEPPVLVRAQAKYVRTSARKARLVCDHIRGKDVEEAFAVLAHTPRAVAEDWEKLLKSA